MSATLLHGVVLEVKPLAVLSSWEPIGSRLESLVDSARGTGTISEADVVKLRAWARRWAKLPESVRAFYALHAGTEGDLASTTARVVLWKVLNGQRPEDWQVRKLEKLWEQDHRVLPVGIDLAPRLT